MAQSNAQRMIKKFGKMAENYQLKINRQSAIIDRLVMANAAYADFLYSISNDVTNMKDAKTLAEQTHEKVKGILAVEEEKEENTDES